MSVSNEDATGLAQRLRHVYWIGGGSGSGKSTIARLLATAHGLRVYATDEVMADHARRLPPDQAPLLQGFADMTMDQRWVTRTPREMLDTFHWFDGEGFGLIIDDLLALPADEPVLAEGFRLLPHLVQPLLTVPTQAVWLLPTPQFRREVFDARGGTTWGFIAKTSDPPRALANLLERDRMFTQRLADEVHDLGLATMEVTGDSTDDDTARHLARLLGLDG